MASINRHYIHPPNLKPGITSTKIRRSNIDFRRALARVCVQLWALAYISPSPTYDTWLELKAISGFRVCRIVPLQTGRVSQNYRNRTSQRVLWLYVATQLSPVRWSSTCITRTPLCKGRQLRYHNPCPHHSFTSANRPYRTQGVVKWLILYFVNTGAVLV